MTVFDKIIQLYKEGFRQKHEATCGPASMIIATRGLGLEEKKESEWTTSSFSQWMPIHQFLDRGMALHELHFISELIYKDKLYIQSHRAYKEDFPLFLRDVEESFKKKETVLIVNYRQADFIPNVSTCPQGSPHYSPMVGYKPMDEKVLLCDIDRFIQDFYWVDIKKLFQSMSQINPAFNLPRGWLVLKKR